MPKGHLDLDKEYIGHDRKFLYSRPLDIHKWSDYPEVIKFVNDTYNEFFLSPNRIKKKHLKVILLDLYAAWFQDPKFHIAVHLSEQAYSNGQVSGKGKTRYNETHIKRTTIDIIHKLVDLDLIDFKRGFGRSDQPSYTTRIWASSRLIRMFENAKFGVFEIHYLGENRKREYLKLRDDKKNDIEYDDTPGIIKMRKVLLDYNTLLEKTFIDVGSLDKPYISLPPSKEWTRTSDGEWKENEPTRVAVAHDGKFVGRVFKNSSWEDGGRFYGGFWQRLGSEHRQKILINNIPTLEIDLSGLHVILAYAEKQIDYWSMTLEDPYTLPVHGVNDTKVAREIIKLFFLMVFNAPTEKLAFRAFRNEWNYNLFRYRFTDEMLLKVLQDIREKHPAISDLICSGAGVKLQYIDSQVIEYIIKDFVANDTPILTLNDSVVVPFGSEGRLEKLMKEAVNAVTGDNKIQVKFNKNITEKALNYRKFLDRDYYLDMYKALKNPTSADGYKRRMERHNRYFNPK